MPSVFVTGFPGFLGSQLVKRLIDCYPPEVKIRCLIQSPCRGLAEEIIAEMTKAGRHSGRIVLHEGDIVRPRLGLGEAYQRLKRSTVEIYHLAAIYKLSVKREIALSVNVRGTKNMLRFAKQCYPHLLRRFLYISTCYVSGSYLGVFEEADLVKGQSFNNYYEETKYLAEIEVQKEMARGLPATIYRPSIVVGDSTTGATQKYDGIYFLIRWLLCQPKVAILPIVGDCSRYELNFVPRNFVVSAIAYLSGLATSEGRVYHLCDPAPLLVDQVIDVVGEAVERDVMRLPLPKSVVRVAKNLRFLQKVMHVEPAALDYLTHPTHYTCQNTQADLEGSGISCPPLASYIENLVNFVRAHPKRPR